jgi:hypothetical protein
VTRLWTNLARATASGFALVLGLAAFAGQADAQIVQNGNFGTTGTTGTLTNGQTVASTWTYVAGNGAGCLIVSDNLSGCGISFVSNPGYSPTLTNFIAIDTNGSGTAGTVQETIGALTAGTRYTLSFYIGEAAETGQSNALVTWTVTLGGTVLTTVSTSTAGWRTTPVAVTFTATAGQSNGLLQFAASTTSGLPPIALLDGVSIPEPASMGLFGIGGIALAALRRRRRPIAA